jgi:Ca2+/Na+ antiporter
VATDKKASKLDAKVLTELMSSSLQQLRRYTVAFFLLLLVAVYGFVLFKVNQLIGQQPDDAAVSSQIKASATPHIDAATVTQMQALQDNSVRVQSLFDQARSNPFQE